jgi:flagellar biosynthesis protein FlhF
VRLRTIQAARMADAIATLRAELGAEAVILSTRRVAGGVEVTAGHDADDEPLVIAPDAVPAARLPEALRRHNLPAALGAQLAGAPLAEALRRALRFDTLPPDGTLLLLGPPGAGKSLSCAKLATRLVLAGTPPLLVSADGRRAGAAEQLAAFARVLNLPLAVAATPGSLGKALARRAEGQPAIVDMPGCDPFDEASVRRQEALNEAARGNAVLVLPAGMDAEEAAEAAGVFRDLGCRRLLPTRLDAARRWGGVLAAASAADLALTEGGTGQEVATGLTPLSPEWLAQRLESTR